MIKAHQNSFRDSPEASLLMCSSVFGGKIQIGRTYEIDQKSKLEFDETTPVNPPIVNKKKILVLIRQMQFSSASAKRQAHVESK